MKKKYSRREFIKISAMGSGALAVSTGLPTRWWGLDAHAVPDPKTDGERIVPSFCELCFWKCGVLAHVRDGRVTKLTGNPAHPLSNGRLCPRGPAGIDLLYDPDRLKKPLLRGKARGEEVFHEVDWNTALDKVAHELGEIKKKYGPEALALFSHGFGGSWFTHFMKAYGSPNVTAPSFAQCRGPRDAGQMLTFGSGLGSPEPLDIENARCITLFGCHLGENMHNTQVQEFANALASGAQLIVVDPRFSIAAGKARYWLPIKPGTDLALLLAWMNVIIEEKRYDAEYLSAHATGFEELRKHVQDKTPEWAAPLTDLDPALIRETARFVSGFRPASMIHPGRHVTWYGDDAQRCRAMAILSALLGNHGRRGGIVQPSKMPLPAYPAPLPEHEMKSPADRRHGKLFPIADEVIASGVCDASVPGRAAYDVKAWMVYGTNLLQALPNPKETIEALRSLDFVVSIDVLPAEICGWSDVVLPEATYLERDDDIYVANYKKPFLALRQEVVKPLYDSKPGWWIAKELATKMGLGESFPWTNGRSYGRKRIEAGGYDWAQLEKTGVILGAPKPTCEENGLKLSFDTDTGKIELYSEKLKKLGLDPIPVYTKHEDPPAGMFRLLMGRAPVHTFGRTTNNKLLLESFPENEVWISKGAAGGIQTGDRVLLVNQDGIKVGPIKAKVTERIRMDCVYLVHGFGHTSRGLSRARGRGVSDSDLVTRYKLDPLMGGTGMNVNFVRFEKA